MLAHREAVHRHGQPGGGKLSSTSSPEQHLKLPFTRRRGCVVKQRVTMLREKVFKSPETES